jgi:hypothetical protein
MVPIIAILAVFAIRCLAQENSNAIVPVPLTQIHSLLNDDYTNLEAGYGIDSNGLSVVAASTYMRGVTGPMVDWWFSWLGHTDYYRDWHPRDHVYAEFVPPLSGEGYVGGHHLVKERIGGELQQLNISFLDPGVYFGAAWKDDFVKANVSTAAVGRVSFYDFDSKTSNPVGHLLHLVHNEPDGVRMRSRFWLGDLGDGFTPPPGVELGPHNLVRGLQKHASEEMAILGTILPDLWRTNSQEGKKGGATGFDKSDARGPRFPGPHGV